MREDFSTNIEGLPEGEYFTEVGYSDRKAWVKTRETPRYVILAKVLVEPWKGWKPEMVPGGFAAHCTNNDSQRWAYGGVDTDYTVRLLKRDGEALRRGGVRYLPNMAVHFYDYNF